MTARTFSPLLAAAVFWAAALTLDAGSGPASPGAGSEPQQFLRTVAGFSGADLSALERGEPLARALSTDKREIAVVGAVRVKAPRGRLLDQYRDVSALRHSQVFQEVGVFSAAPKAEDLSGLTLENYDLDTIRTCKPGDCGVRLPTGSLEQLQREVEWSAPDWRGRAGLLWRRQLAGYTGGYLARGGQALATYENKELPLSVAQEFKVLFDASQYFRPSAPAFFAYLEEFPGKPLDGAEDILYWDKEVFGLRPVVSITHMTLYAPSANQGQPAGPSAFVATKKIYATHYFDAALGLTFAFDDRDGGFYMLCVNRARTRSLTSFIRGMVRMTVQKRCREAMEKILVTTKATLEQMPLSR